ncbi:hypothetical protein ACWCV9_08505 [Streptomyces sp. NPDC001606]
MHGDEAALARPGHEGETGEVRIPLSLFCVDSHLRDADLVLVRPDGEQWPEVKQ